MKHHPFTYFEHYLSGVDHANLHMVTAGGVVLLMALATILVYPRLKQSHANVVPEARMGLKNGLEILMDMLASLCKDVIGHGYEKYFPFIGSVFFFIFFSSLIGMVPGFLPATENWATGTAVAIIVFIAYHMFGFAAQGPGYVKHFFVPISLKGIKNVFLWLAIMLPLILFQVLFGTIELISNLIRPVTLSIRLFVNITADHQVLEAFSGLMAYVLPIPFMMLGIFVCFMQAFIFTLLTMVYISMAVAHDH